MKNFKFKNVYINDTFTLLASLENSPTIRKKVDMTIDDYYMGKKTVEEGEVEYQSIVTRNILENNKLLEEDVDLLIGGDLQNQLFASNFNASDFDIPFLGVYSACASFAQGLIISAIMLEGGFIDNSIVICSASNLVTEKQFRFPIEYGSLRKKTNSFSVSGAVSALLTAEKGNIKIESANIGRIIDMGHTDANDMGACMAPGVAEVIYDHLKSTDRSPDYYDIILTGDLGIYGLFVLREYMLRKYKINLKNAEDAGVILYNTKPNFPFAGASGPACGALVLFSEIIKNYKKILFVGSGALHSMTSTNLKKGMPGIGHAVSLEVLK